MARYIDAEALYNKLYPLDCVDKKTYAINAKAVAYAIDNTPTADVLPRAEVNLYNRQVDELASTYDKLESAKTEAAREIFEEFRNKIRCKIENIEAVFAEGEDEFYDGKIYAYREVINCLDELKKKYTEGIDQT